MKNKWKKLSKWNRIGFIILFLFILAEFILRMIGMGDLAVYRKDKDYEYFYEPNQDVWRFGNHILTNEYGMRSNPVNKKKKITILEFGDSVLNGGAHVDQDNLSSVLEERELNKKYNNKVQVLNISAQSWGPSNAFAFLKKHGDFNADIMVLVFSSHDLYDNMHFREVVGVHPAWPDEKPFLAVTDAWSKFVWPVFRKTFTGKNEYDYLKGFNDSKENPGWKNFIKYCQTNDIKLFVFLHASTNELKNKKYNHNGERIISICNEYQIPVIQDLSVMTNEAYIDDVHLNDKGHSLMFELIQPYLEKSVSELL